MEKSSQGSYKAMQTGFCDSHYNNIMGIQNFVFKCGVSCNNCSLFICLKEVNNIVRNDPIYHFICAMGIIYIEEESYATEVGKVIKAIVTKYHKFIQDYEYPKLWWYSPTLYHLQQ